MRISRDLEARKAMVAGSTKRTAHLRPSRRTDLLRLSRTTELLRLTRTTNNQGTSRDQPEIDLSLKREDPLREPHPILVRLNNSKYSGNSRINQEGSSMSRDHLLERALPGRWEETRECQLEILSTWDMETQMALTDPTNSNNPGTQIPKSFATSLRDSQLGMTVSSLAFLHKVKDHSSLSGPINRIGLKKVIN